MKSAAKLQFELRFSLKKSVAVRIRYLPIKLKSSRTTKDYCGFSYKIMLRFNDYFLLSLTSSQTKIIRVAVDQNYLRVKNQHIIKTLLNVQCYSKKKVSKRTTFYEIIGCLFASRTRFSFTKPSSVIAHYMFGSVV
jgi:hypothetical protein